MVKLNYITATDLDIDVKRGDTFDPIPIVVTSNSASFDFTGYDAVMQIKSNKEDDSPILILNQENGGLTLSTGQISLYISAEDMDLEPGNYHYDLQMSYPTGVTKTWLQGSFNVKQDVTR